MHVSFRNPNCQKTVLDNGSTSDSDIRHKGIVSDFHRLFRIAEIDKSRRDQIEDSITFVHE